MAARGRSFRESMREREKEKEGTTQKMTRSEEEEFREEEKKQWFAYWAMGAEPGCARREGCLLFRGRRSQGYRRR